MARLTTCSACGASISASATACPQCGHPLPKRTSVGTWVVGGGFALLVFSCIMSTNDRPPKPEKTESQKRTEGVMAQQEAARVRKVADVALTLKNASKDPASFELRSAEYQADGVVCLQYRAKNSFNAMLQGSALQTNDGKILVQERDGNRFVSAWNKFCLTTGLPYSREVAAIISR